MEEDVLIKVTLNNIHRFIVVINKHSLIGDLKKEIENVSELLLSAADFGKIISVQSCCHHELPDIYKVGRLLKEGDTILAYSTSHDGSYNTNSQTTVQRTSSETQENSSFDVPVDHDKTVDQDDLRDLLKGFTQEKSAEETLDYNDEQECSKKSNEITATDIKEFGSSKRKRINQTKGLEIPPDDDEIESMDQEKEKEDKKKTDDTGKGCSSRKVKSRNKAKEIQTTSSGSQQERLKQVKETEDKEYTGSVVEEASSGKGKNRKRTQDFESALNNKEQESMQQGKEKIDTGYTDDIGEIPSSGKGETTSKPEEIVTIARHKSERESMKQAREKVVTVEDISERSSLRKEKNRKKTNKIQTPVKSKSEKESSKTIQEKENANRFLDSTLMKSCKDQQTQNDVNIQKKNTLFKKKDFILQSGKKHCSSEVKENKSSQVTDTSIDATKRNKDSPNEAVAVTNMNDQMLEETPCSKESTQQDKRSRKRSRTHSIDESLADHDQRNKTRDSPSGSQPSSSISDLVFKSETFKAMLESGCRHPRRRQAIEKSVTRVANWLVESEGVEDIPSPRIISTEALDNLRKDTKDQCTLDSLKSHTTEKACTIELYSEDSSKPYPVIDVLPDRVLYFDSEPSDASSSGGIIKETYLSSCKVLLPKLTVTQEMLKALKGKTNEVLSIPQELSFNSRERGSTKKSKERPDVPVSSENGWQDKTEEDCAYGSHGIVGSSEPEDWQPANTTLKHLTSLQKPLPSNVMQPHDHGGEEDVDESCFSTEILNNEEEISKVLGKGRSSPKKLRLPADIRGTTANETEGIEEQRQQTEVKSTQEEKTLEKEVNPQTENERLVYREESKTRPEQTSLAKTQDDRETDNETSKDVLDKIGRRSKKKERYLVCVDSLCMSSQRKKKEKSVLLERDIAPTKLTNELVMEENASEGVSSPESNCQKNRYASPSKLKRSRDAICSDDTTGEDSQHSLKKDKKKREKRNRMQEKIVSASSEMEKFETIEKDGVDNDQNKNLHKHPNRNREARRQENKASLPIKKISTQGKSANFGNKEILVRDKFADLSDKDFLTHECSIKGNSTQGKLPKHLKNSSSKDNTKIISKEKPLRTIDSAQKGGAGLQSYDQSSVTTPKKRDDEPDFSEQNDEYSCEISDKKKRKKKKEKNAQESDAGLQSHDQSPVKTSKERDDKPDFSEQNDECCGEVSGKKKRKKKKEKNAQESDADLQSHDQSSLKTSKERDDKPDFSEQNDECCGEISGKKKRKKKKGKNTQESDADLQSHDQSLVKTSKEEENEPDFNKKNYDCSEEISEKKKKKEKYRTEVLTKVINEGKEKKKRKKEKQKNEDFFLEEELLTQRLSSSFRSCELTLQDGLLNETNGKTVKHKKKKRSDKIAEKEKKEEKEQDEEEEKNKQNKTKDDATGERVGKKSKKDLKVSNNPDQVEKPVFKSSKKKKDFLDSTSDEIDGKILERDSKSLEKMRPETKAKNINDTSHIALEKDDEVPEPKMKVPKKKQKKSRKVCKEDDRPSQNESNGLTSQNEMFTSGSESDIAVSNVLSWISKKINDNQTPQTTTTAPRKTNKSKLLDLALDENELSTPKTAFLKPTLTTSSAPAFTPGFSSIEGQSRPFQKTPKGFTNTVPRITKKSNSSVASVSSSRRKRKLCESTPQTRELTEEEKEMVSGGVNGLDKLFDVDSFWSS